MEAVASPAYTHPEFSATGRESSPGDHPRSQPERLLAFIQNAGRSCRYDKTVAPPPGTCVSQIPVGRPCSSSPNRLMRTRMSGGVGGGSRKAIPYPDLCGGSNRNGSHLLDSDKARFAILKCTEFTADYGVGCELPCLGVRHGTHQTVTPVVQRFGLCRTPHVNALVEQCNIHCRQ